MMLVVPNKKKLVLNTSKHADVLTYIPHAKTFVHEGKTLVAVEHGVEETLVLKNMGFKSVPAPILNYYDWPGRVQPMHHQRDTASFLTLHRKALCLNAPGTGKTLSTLWAADYLLSTGVVSKILIIAPLSTLKPVWGKEIRQHFSHRVATIITGDRKKREHLLGSDHHFAIVNHDGFSTMPKAFAGYDLVIYDEGTALKTPTSLRFRKFFAYMTEYNPWLWILTGTPIAQNPTDAWALAKLVGSKTLPRSFTAFKDLTMQKITTFKWIPRVNALDICKKVMQPSIRYDLAECMDLPETVFIDRECELTPVQHAAFELMRDQACLIAEDITAANAAVMFQKLLQICCGVAYNNDKEHIKFDDANRTDTLKEILDEIGDKVIIYVPLRGVQDHLKAFLVKHGYDVASVHGDVSKKDRDMIFDKFQNSGEIQILLAHPKVASHGLTLTRAKSIIWYAPIYSLEMYEQANARIKRLTTQGKTVVYHIYATHFEKELYRRLKEKQRVLVNFLNMVKGINE